MNNLNKTINGKDYVFITVILIVTVMALYSTYWMVTSTPIKIIIWIIWLLVFCVLGFFTRSGQTVCLFFNESKIELQKVVWPNRQETVQTTLIVMIMVSVMGFVLWAIDSIMLAIIAKITHLG